MSNPDKLPDDIAVAIEALDDWHDDALRGYGGGDYGSTRAALDAAILRNIGGGWRPISTAPKDGAAPSRTPMAGHASTAICRTEFESGGRRQLYEMASASTVRRR